MQVLIRIFGIIGLILCIIPFQFKKHKHIVLCEMAFELFLDFGNQMRAISRAKQTILIQLVCDSLGYLPTEKAEKGSHYSAYVSSGYVGHEGGDLLVRKTVEEINKMW